jgi:hypothetical protein
MDPIALWIEEYVGTGASVQQKLLVSFVVVLALIILNCFFQRGMIDQVEDNGVPLAIRYLCEPRNLRGGAEQIWESVFRAFTPNPDLDFAYLRRRYYGNRTEGKQVIAPAPDLDKGKENP